MACSFGTSGINNPAIYHNLPEDPNPWHKSRGNLECHVEPFALVGYYMA